VWCGCVRPASLIAAVVPPPADVLNFLRDGSLAYPPPPYGCDYKYLLELRAEGEFYGLTGLVEAVDRYVEGGGFSVPADVP